MLEAKYFSSVKSISKPVFCAQPFGYEQQQQLAATALF
jgi:hypothetical protein